MTKILTPKLYMLRRKKNGSGRDKIMNFFFLREQN